MRLIITGALSNFPLRIRSTLAVRPGTSPNHRPTISLYDGLMCPLTWHARLDGEMLAAVEMADEEEIRVNKASSCNSGPAIRTPM